VLQGLLRAGDLRPHSSQNCVPGEQPALNLEFLSRTGPLYGFSGIQRLEACNKFSGPAIINGQSKG
jgi:uncharacterized ParB-like nuclease family protein